MAVSAAGTECSGLYEVTKWNSELRDQNSFNPRGENLKNENTQKVTNRGRKSWDKYCSVFTRVWNLASENWGENFEKEMMNNL